MCCCSWQPPWSTYTDPSPSSGDLTFLTWILCESCLCWWMVVACLLSTCVKLGENREVTCVQYCGSRENLDQWAVRNTCVCVFFFSTFSCLLVFWQGMTKYTSETVLKNRLVINKCKHIYSCSINFSFPWWVINFEISFSAFSKSLIIMCLEYFLCLHSLHKTQLYVQWWMGADRQNGALLLFVLRS